jgi:hypothetical protein
MMALKYGFDTKNENQPAYGPDHDDETPEQNQKQAGYHDLSLVDATLAERDCLESHCDADNHNTGRANPSDNGSKIYSTEYVSHFCYSFSKYWKVPAHPAQMG